MSEYEIRFICIPVRWFTIRKFHSSPVSIDCQLRRSPFTMEFGISHYAWIQFCHVFFNFLLNFWLIHLVSSKHQLDVDLFHLFPWQQLFSVEFSSFCFGNISNPKAAACANNASQACCVSRRSLASLIQSYKVDSKCIVTTI